ncbi:hypothetical protein VitviT2T_002852 [Vitis vinifera]|uniref:Peptidase A1 domain-containing protein n=1 Tax=Vitis vinifera TaxID=29760 RepID=A0ABY9BJR0_VITVI|nr:hypothetical protein VitviT2T_002852 [Vitis vinifera]
MEGFGVKIFFNVVVVGFLFQLLEVALARGGGFSVDLIHRDSPHSPFFDPSKTQAERLTDAFRRSVSRVGRFRPTAMTSDGIQSRIVPSAGEYLMNLYIGTPPVPVIAIVDTGSDLTWTQCRPCTHCYKQVVPLFDPKNSSTYRDSSCGTSFCLALGKDRSCSKEKKCTFRYSYADGSFTGGNLASETLTVDSTAGKPVSFPGFAFGCGHSSGGIFDKSSSGIVGLGGGELSLISQLKSTINGLFSYCLLPVSTDSSISSRINFGASGRVSGYGTVSTPLVQKSPDTFYYLTLEGISVGKKRLPYKGYSKKTEVEEKAEVEEGNIIVDSGTTYTYLPLEFYVKLEESVAHSIKGKRVRDPNGISSLCYNTGVKKLEIPTITAHFIGADVQLPPLNTFVQAQEDLVCFSMIPSSNLAIFGNLSQMNFLVGYDLKNNKVSFKPTDCTKQ